MDDIYEKANIARKIFQYGSGVGIPIGNLREENAYIYEGENDKPPEGRSSGPLTFMKLYDAIGETTKSGGRVRRAAILCSMPVWHPDIIKFIKVKKEDGRLNNMNISVSITDKFMQSLKDNIPFKLISPYMGKEKDDIDPNVIWDNLCKNAWESADPGVLFIDTINKYNPLKKDVLIETPNPCGEQTIIPNSCCNLSAINISKFVNSDSYDWKGLYDTAFNIMEFMDNVIDTMDYPDKCFEENSKKYRQVGIGIMGLADTLYMLDYRYDGPEGRNFASKVMKTITTACVHKSALLAKEKGKFYNYDFYKEDVEEIIKKHIGFDEKPDENTKNVMNLVIENGLRNVQFTTCQPCGTVALSCDCSYGIEPIFGLTFQKNIAGREKMIMVNDIFKEKFKNESWFTENIIEKIEKNGGTLKGIHGIPKEVKDVFVVAHDIKPKDRIDMQAALQKYTSTAISSTVNLSRESSVEDVSEIYKYAYERELKGITIYRDGCKKGQPITFKEEKENIKFFSRPGKLSSNTFKIETGNGTMYITISDYNGKPLEVFMHLGKSGQVWNTFAEGLGRIISIALQKGVEVKEIVKTLININSDRPVWFRFEETDKKPEQILSIPDAIAKVLKRYYLNEKHIVHELSDVVCEKCGEKMLPYEGCFNCLNCGNSKCS
jgi:ribonucleoside-diphosphate reductase alpha chain